jgi:hypothetical protein
MRRTWGAVLVAVGLAGVVGCAGTARPMCFRRNAAPCPVEYSAPVPSGGPILSEGMPMTTFPATAVPPAGTVVTPPVGTVVTPPPAYPTPPTTSVPPLNQTPPVGPQPRTTPAPGASTNSTKATR